MLENSPVKISIVIPVKNGESTLKLCLESIFKQTLIHQSEVIIIDSGSTDGTLDIIKEFPVRLYEIPPHEFNHGSTRNYGVSLAKGEFVVMTVQDATPVGTLWLETMYHHFINSQIAGVCGQQIVPHHKDKNPHKWFRPINMPYVNTIQKDTMPMDYIPRGWDNVNAMYRKDILLEIPFRSVAFGEDFLWASDAYNANYKLVFDSNSKVEHYHHAIPSYVYNRVTTELYFEYQHYKTITAYPFSFKELIFIVYRNSKYKAHLKWIWHNWMILYLKNKAWRDVKNAIKNNSLHTLKTKIPQGQQNSFVK